MTNTTDTPTLTWHLDDTGIAAAKAKITRINARAQANGLEGSWSFTVGGEHRDPVYPEGADMMPWGTVEPLYYVVTREFTVTGTAPRLGGWTLLARLTWEGDVLVTRCTPGWDGRIDDKTIKQGACDHCGFSRRRNDCFLVQDAEGNRVQVGTSCLADFLGHDFRPTMIRTLADMDDMAESLGDGGGYEVASVTRILEVASAMTSDMGWISVEKAGYEDRQPSSWILKDILFGSSRAAREDRAKYAPRAAEVAEAARVLAWCQGIDPGTGSEYLANLRRLAGAEYVTERSAGMLGSAVASYRREMARDAEKTATVPSEWFGQAKDKVSLPGCLVISDTPVEGDYGVRHLYRFRTAEGNVATWWSTRNLNLEPGATVTLAGTIKTHEEYKEVKETVLLRCKVEVTTPAP